MDVGWVVAAGHDPLALMKAHPGRFTQMHVKDVLATTKPNFVFQQDPTEIARGSSTGRPCCRRPMRRGSGAISSSRSRPSPSRGWRR